MPIRFNRATFAPEDGAGGGASGADINAMIEAAVAKAVSGLSAKNQELLDEAKRAKQTARDLENKLRSLGDEGDIEKARALMEQMQADADLRMIVEGGKTAYEEVINRRTKSVVSRVEQEKIAAENAAKEAAARAEAMQNRWKQERLATAVNTAVGKAKALPEASEYIYMKAAALFEVDDEKGEPRLRADKVNDVIDRQGNPHTLDTFVDSLRDTNPFFFGVPSGGGANGGTGRGGRNEPARINAADSAAVSNNLEAIASGKVVLAS
jgi:hypothetical protein